MRRTTTLWVGLILLATSGYSAAQQPPPGGLGTPFQRPPVDYKELIPALIDALKDSDAQVRYSAASALADIGKPAVPALLDILKGKDQPADLRANVAYILGQMGSIGQEAVPVLTKLLKDDDAEIRRRAAYALQRFVKESSDSSRFGLPGMLPTSMGGGRTGGSIPVKDPGLITSAGDSGQRSAPPAKPDEKKEEKK
jgi:hypothetical protein